MGGEETTLALDLKNECQVNVDSLLSQGHTLLKYLYWMTGMKPWIRRFPWIGHPSLRSEIGTQFRPNESSSSFDIDLSVL